METERVEFTPRPYQTKIAELAKEKNTIIFLPTGSGKTYIAVLVMKHFLSLERRPFSAGGKRCFFIVNTVVLVDQQANVLERHLPIKNAGRYFGAMNVDNWSREMWRAEYEAHETLVMTAEIFRMTLAHGFITPSQIAVIVFDECHRAVGDSPMLQAARLITERSREHKPRMIGLSATLLNANAKTLWDAQNSVAELLRTFDAVLGCVTGDGVRFFSTKPKEQVIAYVSGPVEDPKVGAALQALEQAKRYSSVFGGDLVSCRLNSSYIEKLIKMKKEVTNQLVDVEVQFENLGVYGGSKAALLAIKLLEFMKLSETNVSVLLQVTQAVNALTSAYGLWTMATAACPEPERAYSCSSQKVKTLAHLLLDVQEKTIKKDEFRCLVLVQRKMTARMVCTVLKHIARISRYSFIKPVFLVGNSGSPDPFPGNVEDFETMNRQAMKCFESGTANVLVSTEVTEEGIDIPLCNCVIKFDKILSYRSYMQSKGRARSKESHYFVMETKDEIISTVQRLDEYSKIQDHLTSIVTDTETDADTLSEGLVTAEEPETYDTKSATLYDVAAMSILVKYISMFNYDRYTVEAPEWKILKVSGNGRPTNRKDNFDDEGQPCHFIAQLKLPQTVPIQLCVQSKVKASMKLAKRNAAFQMCVQLHEHGELNDDLIPVAPGSHFTPDPSWWPHSNITEELKGKMKGDRLGTKEQGQLYFSRVPKCLTNCSPIEGQEVFLHLLNIKPTVRPVDRQYGFIFDRVQEDGNFGLLTTTCMPKVCPFPVYSKIGELAIDFIPNYTTVILNDHELALLESFAQVFFCLMIPCLTLSECQMENGGKDYFVVPTKTNFGRVTVDWTAVSHSLKLLDIGKPSDEERLTMEVRNETYSGAVIVPWYRGSDKVILIVTRIEQQMTAMSKFPALDCNFRERFLREYKVETLRPDLPLLETKPFSKCCNGLKKKTITVQSRSEEQHYVADLVNLLPLSANLWVKAIMMPTILFRLERLLIAEEVRSTIALEASLGYVNPPADFVWQRLEEEGGGENHNRQSPDVRVSELTLSRGAEPVGKPVGKPVAKSVCKEENDGCKRNFIAEFWEDDAGAQNTYFLQKIYDQDCLKRVFGDEKFQSFNLSSVKQICDEVPNVEVPFPRLLRSVGNPEGLQLNKVLAALTAPSANDLVNYERMETLGDSFLKVAVSLFLYEACPLRSEGLLTNLKGRFIGNRNLFDCALNKKLPEVMATRDFPLPNGWFPPKFISSTNKILHRKANHVAKNDVDDLIVKFSNVSLNEKPRFVSVNELNALETSNGTHLISDKAVADCVEALLGATLLDCGWNGALDVLVWFQIVPEMVKRNDGTVVPIKRLLQKGNHEPIFPTKNDFANEVDKMQSVLRYTFKEPKFLLQALTHPSRDAQNSYERLEFIGDAVLDFLITSYIYENCGLLTPGKLTDLRSALVNNVTFAALSAKYGFNKYILLNSPVLMQAIDAFITSQQKSDHRIDSDLLIVCDDEEVQISEQITVPKALADLFEALAGAVFFDSGRDLNVVWKVFYPIMSTVIESFCKDIPIDPVRQLYETYTGGVSFEYNRDENKSQMIATCIVQIDSKRHRFHGYGENKKMAKKAVAKFALHSLKMLQNGVSLKVSTQCISRLKKELLSRSQIQKNIRSKLDYRVMLRKMSLF